MLVIILFLYLLCNDCLNWWSSCICICCVMIVWIGGHLIFVFVVQECLNWWSSCICTNCLRMLWIGGHFVYVFVVQEMVATVVILYLYLLCKNWLHRWLCTSACHRLSSYEFCTTTSSTARWEFVQGQSCKTPENKNRQIKRWNSTCIANLVGIFCSKIIETYLLSSGYFLYKAQSDIEWKYIYIYWSNPINQKSG